MTRGILFSIFILLTSCKNQGYELHVLFENGDGVEVGDLVQQNDKQVGVVSEVNLTDDYEVLINLQFQDSMPSKGSTFSIKHLNILGDRAIEMNAGPSSVLFESGDTVKGMNIQPKSETKTISSLLEKISMLLSQEENDSLMREIQGLKAKVDSLENVRNNIDSTRQSLPDSFPQSSGT